MSEAQLHVADAEKANFSKIRPIGLIMAIVGIGGMLLLGMSHSDMLFGSYLFGVAFWLSVTFGCLGLALLHHAIKGSWSFAILRLLEAGGGWQSLVLMALLFVPIILGLPHLYEWARPDVVQNDPVLQNKAIYLNPTSWLIRLVFYFVVWIFLAAYMQRSSEKQDETLNLRLEAKRASWGAAGMVAFMLTATFAAIDWLMSMDPHWYSTMYGAWVVVSSAYVGLAFCTAVICNYADKAPFNQIVYPGLTRDLGNMLFTLTMLWGYTTLSQFLIIWNGGIPETTQYYATRMALYPAGMAQNYWAVVGFILTVGMFFVPFYCLLTPRNKKYPSNLKKVCLWMFAMAIINMYLIVIPSVPERAVLGPISAYTLTDLLALVGVGGLWMIVFGTVAARGTLLYRFDTRLQEAKNSAH